MRKEAGFEVMDKIRVYAKDNDKIVDIMKNMVMKLNLKSGRRYRDRRDKGL